MEASEMSKTGLYRKYSVQRIDGKDAPGEKHSACEYFVLDLNHDPHAVPALQAYAKSCRIALPQLAEDLRATIARLEERQRILSVIEAATPAAHGHPLMGADEQIAIAMDKLRSKIQTGDF